MTNWKGDDVQVSSALVVLMVVLGGFGTAVHFGMIGKTVYEYRGLLVVTNLPKRVARWSTGSSGSTWQGGNGVYVKRSRLSRRFLFIEFSLWISNLLACAIWFLLRTDLLFWGGGNKYFDVGYCRLIYTANFVLFFSGKFWLHLARVYRLHLAFSDTFFEIKKKLLRGLAALIVLSVLLQIGLFVIHLRREVEVGKTRNDLRICTLYYAANKKVHKYSHVAFPLLFGCVDTLIDVITICLFIRQLTVSHKSHDSVVYLLIRKLTVLGTLQILVSLVLYTLAVPFYPNLAMLGPLNAVMDSLCIFLAPQFAHTFYNVLCFPCDKLAEAALERVGLNSSPVTEWSIELDVSRRRAMSAPAAAQRTQPRTVLRPAVHESVLSDTVERHHSAEHCDKTQMVVPLQHALKKPDDNTRLIIPFFKAL